MSLLDSFQNAYLDVQEVLEEAKNFFHGDSIKIDIKMNASYEEDAVKNPILEATMTGKDFSDWEEMAMWIDDKDGELLEIDVYDDGIFIKRSL